MIRGGVSLVFDKRLFKANNIYLDDYNNGDYDTYGVFLDANILYGGVKEKQPLPPNSFETIRNLNSNKFLETSNNYGEGYIL